jgi:hypothetical protein
VQDRFLVEELGRFRLAAAQQAYPISWVRSMKVCLHLLNFLTLQWPPKIMLE